MKYLYCTGAVLVAHILACAGSPPEDADRDGWDEYDDCDDHDASVHPDATEYCDGEDDDCDGQVDEWAADAIRSWDDDDGDGYGDPDASTQECSIPWGHVTNDDDCDDHDASSHPYADEYCDGDDNDCDGRLDEDPQDAPSWYADADGDGFGDATAEVQACEAPAGFTDDANDCDDGDAAIHPGAVEDCGSGQDEDCEPLTPDDCGYRLVDLDSADATLLARAAGERVGWAVAGAGDVDDDGNGDLILGGPGAGTAADGAYVVLGPVSGRVSLSYAEAHLEGSAAGVEAGYAVAGGDVNDDGYSDLLLGAPAESEDGAITGAAYLFYGPDVADCEPYCEGATLAGEQAGDRAGAAVALGDVHGDGYLDLLVGAPSRWDAGAAYLVFGPPDGQVLLGDADLVLSGASDGGAAGSALGMGDLDDDGRADVLVLDPAAGAGGTLYVVTDASVTTLDLGAAPVRLVGEQDASFGSFSAGGDLDDDGDADLIVGLTLESGDAAERAALIWYGPLEGELTPDGADAWIDSQGLYANGGLVVAAGGDVDRDGADDLLLGAPEAEVMAGPDLDRLVAFPGSVFVLRGPFGPGALPLGEGSVRLWTEQGRDLERFSIAFAGDQDRDGSDDVLIGAWRDGTIGSEAGLVWVIGGDRL